MSLVGCRDFSNVRKLGENSKEIAAKSQEMATDYYQSCLRRARVPIDTFPDIANTRAAAEEACRQNDRELGMANRRCKSSDNRLPEQSDDASGQSLQRDYA
ncbi:hypothetical protein H6F80_16360 [Leptolyngbya sp. FACHB-711]|nr:hypothetical protein [Leptolyngbya sp. FACHB-711]